MSSITSGGAATADRIRRIEAGQSAEGDGEINVGMTERWASGIVGGMLVAHGLRRGTLAGLGEAILGGALAYRAYTGHCTAYEAVGISTATGRESKGADHHKGVLVVRSYTVARSPEECYTFWRNFENLPRFMSHLESVKVLDDRRSHWVAKAPLGQTVAWEAEIIHEEPNRVIAWRSVEGADITNAGSVRFRPAPGDRGTEVTVEINYEPPAGRLGATIAWLLGEEPSWQVSEDLRKFKQLMETGEIPTIAGQASCRGRD